MTTTHPHGAASATNPVGPAVGRRWIRTARWIATFVGFPLGGLAASIVVGPVNSTVTALLGGLLTGAVLGAVQALGLRLRGRAFVGWMIATAVGLGAGLALGGTVVGFATSVSDLLVQGAVSGFIVGASQALLLRRDIGPIALAWPPVIGALWALGWFITVSAGIDVDMQWPVFGASGAIAVAILTAILPAFLAKRAASNSLVGNAS